MDQEKPRGDQEQALRKQGFLEQPPLHAAGKGHEDYQEIKGVKLPFADADVARRILEGYATC